MHYRLNKIFLLLVVIALFSGCGSDSKAINGLNSGIVDENTNNSSGLSGIKPNGNTGSSSDCNNSAVASYRGLQFYYENLPKSQYKLEQLSDNEFNALSSNAKLKVANKLLESLFFGYPHSNLKEKIDSQSFLSNVFNALSEENIDTQELESAILDNSKYVQYRDKSWAQPQVLTILTRFYEMNKLDKYYLQNWISYILTQTIMFSPAYELGSTHAPNIANVYNRIVNMLSIDSGMRYITYVHMMSEENWRRFRSPEDNGREMLEIYTLNARDSDVPLAAKALQNWRLNTDSDTLEVGLNKNHSPIKLFNTTLFTGEDFYRELVKSKSFEYGVTKRLVDFFFPKKSESKRDEITKSIVSSNPQKWQDILLQIIFSKEYLLNNQRALSAEERFYSLAKKMKFKAKRNTFHSFKNSLTRMNQASMKYKLGKLERVPLDSLSFANYHKLIREEFMLNIAINGETNRDSWRYDGWSLEFIDASNFSLEGTNEQVLTSYINYLFMATIQREATASELKLFKEHMLSNGKFKGEFNILTRRDNNENKEREERRKRVAIIVLDYISRLDELYMQREVKQ
jgi:hypothetical protein